MRSNPARRSLGGMHRSLPRTGGSMTGVSLPAAMVSLFSPVIFVM